MKNVLNPVEDAEVIEKFLDAVYAARQYIKVGFDSCTIPALLKYGLSTQEKSYLDTCEGGRYSAYITSDSFMLPCSFDQPRKYAVDISEIHGVSIKEAWNSNLFYCFRFPLLNPKGECKSCGDWKECMGGCPLMPEIVPCADK